MQMCFGSHPLHVYVGLSLNFEFFNLRFCWPAHFVLELWMKWTSSKSEAIAQCEWARNNASSTMLHNITRNNSAGWEYVHFILLVQVIFALSSLFFLHKKPAWQKNYNPQEENYIVIEKISVVLATFLFVRHHEVCEVYLGSITAFGKAHIAEKSEAKRKT